MTILSSGEVVSAVQPDTFSSPQGIVITESGKGMNEVGSDHESFSMLVAAVVIGVALSVGPALLAEFLAQKLRQSVPLARRYTLAKNRHRSAERERNAAEKNMIRRHNAIECYNRRVDRLMGFLRAIGNRHFSRRSGRTPTGETEREVLQNE